MSQPEPSSAFLMECIFKLHLRIQALEQTVVDLTAHRHDDWGRVYASDGITCRFLGGRINLENQPEQP